jgi:hypothetical protein
MFQHCVSVRCCLAYVQALGQAAGTVTMLRPNSMTACCGCNLNVSPLQVERCKAVAAAKHMKAAATVSGHQQRRQQQQHAADGSAEQAQPPAAAAAAAAGGSTPAAGPGKTAGYNVAYVGNIAFEAGPDDLKALFAECGVTKVSCGGSERLGAAMRCYRTALWVGRVAAWRSLVVMWCSIAPTTYSARLPTALHCWVSSGWPTHAAAACASCMQAQHATRYCHALLQVRLHTDKATGKSRGYAHVHFADEAGLDADGLILCSHSLSGKLECLLDSNRQQCLSKGNTPW